MRSPTGRESYGDAVPALASAIQRQWSAEWRDGFSCGCELGFRGAAHLGARASFGGGRIGGGQGSFPGTYELMDQLVDLAEVLVEGWLNIEREASLLGTWQPIVVPGLLRTVDYAKALRAGQLDTSDDVPDQLVAAWLGRQGIFDGPEPPSLCGVLDQAVLHRLVGSPKIIYDQLPSGGHLDAVLYLRQAGVAGLAAVAGAGPDGASGRTCG